MKKDVFKKANNLQEVQALARELRRKGYDVMEINSLASARKRELITGENPIDLLTKIIPKSGTFSKSKVSKFIIEVQSLSAGKIEITSDGKVIL